jgi:uncharacterized membrane protein YedE/YeeE
MARLIGSFVCGLIFGVGLMVSGMADPQKVLSFLDIFGAWDPSLAVVMAAALAVTSLGYAFARRRARPLFAESNFWPADGVVDRNLVAGAALFGVGWGLTGLCPGPAIENLATLSPQVLAFVAAMIAGMMARETMTKREDMRAAATAAADG